MSRLRIAYPKPGFFLADVRVVIGVDGQVVYDGGFVSGFDVDLHVDSGAHVVTSEIKLPPISRKREYRVDVGMNEEVTATLVYSRLWGNFKKTLSIARAPFRET